jgi:hypothetical protein
LITKDVSQELTRCDFYPGLNFYCCLAKSPTKGRTCPSYPADIAKQDIMLFGSACVGREQRSLVDHPALLAIGAEQNVLAG